MLKSKSVCVGASAALLTGSLLMLLFAVYRIFPFGSKTVVWCDMVQQGVPLLVQLKQMALRGEWLGYTALDAGGMQFYGVFFFFLSNPFSFLIFLSSLRADYLVGLLVAAKMALSAGTAAFWLRQHTQRLPASLQILLGMMYGCCGYGLFYYQNLMWLDIMALFPLLLWGLERLFQSQKPLVYFAVLCMMTVSCFYLCYMAVLFILLYGALSLRFTVPKNLRSKTAIQFFAASLLAALLTAPVWLTCFLQVSRSARTGGLLRSLAAAMPFHSTADKLALLLCTGLALAAIPHLRQAAPRIPFGRMQRGWRLFVLLGTAILLDPINAMWHTGSYQAFPLRWGMMPVLLLLGCAADLLAAPQNPPQKTKPADILLCGAMLLLTWGSTVFVMRTAGDDLFSYVNTLWVNVRQFAWLLLPAGAAFSAYYLMIRLRRRGRLSGRLCAAMMLPVFLSEILLGFHCYVGNSGGEDKLFAETLSLENVIPAEDFSRVSLTAKYLHPNMLGAAGYPTLAHYTSLTRDDFLHGIKRFGYSSYWMEVTGCGGTALSDALWANRWQVGADENEQPWTEKFAEAAQFSVRRNNLRLPTVLYTDAAPETIAALPDGTRSQVQAYLAETFLGESGLITDFAPTGTENLTLTQDAAGTAAARIAPEAEGAVEFSVFVYGKQALYFDLSSRTDTQLSMPYFESVSVSINGRTVCAEYPQKGNNGLLYLGTVENDFCTVRVQVKQDFTCESFGVFGIEIDRLQEAAARAEGTEFTYAGGVYTAECTLDAPKTLIFSAAYDEGFSAEIDGKPAAVWRVNDCEMAVQAEAGTHQITLRHEVGGMKAAVILAGCGVLLGIGWLVTGKKIRGKAEERLGKAALMIFQGIHCIMIAVVYILPMVCAMLG